MTSSHVYRAPFQPATQWVDRHVDPPITFSGSPHRRIFVLCCLRRRQARFCVVQSYYDVATYWCAEGKGCKDPAYIEAQRRRIFRNRSAGQKRRWQTQ